MLLAAVQCCTLVQHPGTNAYRGPSILHLHPGQYSEACPTIKRRDAAQSEYLYVAGYSSRTRCVVTTAHFAAAAAVNPSELYVTTIQQ